MYDLSHFGHSNTVKGLGNIFIVDIFFSLNFILIDDLFLLLFLDIISFISAIISS